MIKTHVEAGEDLARRLTIAFDLDNPKTAFARKKEVTSALRRFAPFGHSSSLVWTTNHRNLRFVLQKRTEGGAEEEIRKLFDPVGYGMKEMFPNLYQDIYRRESGEWVSKFSARGLADDLRRLIASGPDGGVKNSSGIEALLKERGL
jgi:thymidylate synthase (FAD)